MDGLGLYRSYGRYLAALPATTLATTNLITHLALHRRLLPALLGHLALFETGDVDHDTTTPVTPRSEPGIAWPSRSRRRSAPGRSTHSSSPRSISVPAA